MKTILVTSMIAGIFSPFALQASSGLDGVVTLTDAQSLQINNDKTFFSQTGLSGEDARVVNGGGILPLEVLLKNIVPKGWEVNTSGNTKSLSVTWRGGISWSQILYQVANKERVYIGIDWVSKQVSVNVPDGAGSGLVSKSPYPTKTEVAQDKVTAASASSGKNSSLSHKKTDNDTQPKIKSFEQPKWDTQKKLVAATPVKRDQKIVQQKVAQASQSTLISADQAKKVATDSYIKELESREKIATLEKERLAKDLATTQKERDEIKKAAGLTSNLTVQDTGKSTAQLVSEYESRYVLPFDKSFDYFKKGGYKDTFGTDTPATFVAKRGTVESIIKEWAKVMHYDVDYRAETIFENEYEISFKGTFFDATTQFIELFQESDRPLKVKFYPDVKASSGGQGLVVISDMQIRDPNSIN